MSRGVSHRRSLDLALLWLWRRPAAVAPTGPLAWEPPYATDAALKRQKKKKEGSFEKSEFIRRNLANMLGYGKRT